MELNPPRRQLNGTVYEIPGQFICQVLIYVSYFKPAVPFFTYVCRSILIVKHTGCKVARHASLKILFSNVAFCEYICD